VRQRIVTLIAIGLGVLTVLLLGWPFGVYRACWLADNVEVWFAKKCRTKLIIPDWEKGTL
jgi:hypothetical protein